MLAYLLFFFYLFSGTVLLHIIIRRKIFPFTIYHTASIVLFKVFMGCLYGYLFLNFYKGDDTWNYFIESRDQTNLLLKHPLQFMQEFWPGYALQQSEYHGGESLVFYITHFERWFMIKGLAILNLFSFKNYYTDVLLFEFLTIAGPLLLFKLLARFFPLRTGMYFLLVFFVPSVVFWNSGIRAEAILLLSMVLMMYNGAAYAHKRRGKHLAGILAGMAGLLLIRYQYLLVFIPFYFAYTISLRKQVFTPVIFNRIFIVLALVFLASLFLPPGDQGSRPIRASQQSFFQLQGNTRYALDSLKPGPVSFISILPQAFRNSILRPYPWEGKNLLQSVSSIDVIFLFIGIFYFMVSPVRKQQVMHPIYWLFLYYALCQLILIGYTVPFPGAIVRYRSISFLLLFLFLYGGNPLLQQKLRFWIFKLH